MNLFIKYYLEIILIILIGLLMNPDNGVLKISIFFIMITWAFFHYFIIKNLFDGSKMIDNLILESNEIEESEKNKTKTKIKNKIRKYTSFIIIFSIFCLFIYKGGLFLSIGILFFIIEITKIIKIMLMVKKSESIINH